MQFDNNGRDIITYVKNKTVLTEYIEGMVWEV